MDEKISLEAIALYGDTYADKVLKGFFSSKNPDSSGQVKISGNEILSLCNVQQVNLFIVKELFRAWKEETKKLKSPYFDFENTEVKQALDNLMTILSKNISISQPYFAPLLKKAVSQALLVIFNPYDFYSMLLTGKNNKLDVPVFKEEIRYLKINKPPLERMLQKLEEMNKTEISGNEALALLDQILEEVNFTPDDVDQYIQQFSEVAPLDPSRFYIVQNHEEKHQPVYNMPVQESKPQDLPKPVETKAVTAQPKPTVNEKLNREGKPTIAENFQRISKIKDSLTINQKFMFTKVLFHGDFELFSKAIDRLDQLDNLQAALRYIEDEYASTWDRDSEEFHEFMELVEKRFV